MTSTPSGSKAVSAAPISEPSSIVPVVSTVTCAISGTLNAERRHRATRADDRRLRLEEVLAGLDDDRVGAALDHAGDLLLVGVAQDAVMHVAEGRQLRAGADRAEHPARAVGCRPPVGDLLGQRGAGAGQFADPLDDVVLAEVGPVGAERVRLDGVRARPEVGVVHVAHDVGPGDVEDLVAALEALEVVQSEVGSLQHRAHRAVGDDDTLTQRVEQRRPSTGFRHGHQATEGPTRLGATCALPTQRPTARL